MRRPPLPADNRAALKVLIDKYSDLLLPGEREALWAMWGRPALTVIDRLRLTVLARTALDRAAAEGAVMPHDQFDSEDLRRLNTWTGAIAQALRPEAPVAFTTEGIRLGRRGALPITAADGWYDHESGKGGKCALSLIAHLRSCKAAGAILWARTWLAEHPGDGELSADGAAEAAAEAGERRSAWARQILDEAIDPTDTPAATYLESRGIASPYPQCVRYLPDARTGEGAIVGILTTATGEAVGVQLGFVDPQGRKTTITPQRQLFFIEKNDQVHREGRPGGVPHTRRRAD